MVKAGLIGILCAVLPISLSAQETPRLSITLAGAETTGDACRLSFLGQNELGADLTSLVLEAVIFTKTGAIERLLLLDFQDLPASKQRVRQFDLGSVDCADLGKVLINGAQSCDGVDAGDCIARLQTRSNVKGLEFTG